MENRIESLEAEIRRESSDVLKEDQLLRLKAIAKVYAGDDRVVSSQELFDEVKNAPQKEKFYTGFKLLPCFGQGLWGQFFLGQFLVLLFKSLFLF